ncbi:MAG: MFS transporter [Cyclobacteriaceae bacterium]
MNSATLPQLNNSRTVNAWCMYDWANSVYSLVITSAIFPIYYKSIAVSGNGDIVQFLGFSINNSVLYTYSLSFSFLIVALILPLLSGMADYAGKKKTYMKVFVAIGSIACIGLYFFRDVADLEWGIFCSMLASIGYSGSLVFYDAFLPEIVTMDRYDATSARGYSMGYYGSVILMVICLFIITYFNSFGFSTEGDAVRFTFLLVGLWWMGFSLITFRYVPENPYGRKPTGNIWTKGYAELLKVWQSLKASPNLKRYLAAFFFFNMGVQTVMYLATLFGTDVLQLESSKLIMTILLIQMVAAVGAWVSARFSAQYGNKIALMVMIGIWIVVCIAAYFVSTEYQFYALAFVVGLIMGGVQALARATYTKLIPENTIDHASYFSFFDVTYNLSIVFGTFSFGLINQLTGSMRNSALVLAIFFVAGILMLTLVKSEYLKKASSAGA